MLLFVLFEGLLSHITILIGRPSEWRLVASIQMWPDTGNLLHTSQLSQPDPHFREKRRSLSCACCSRLGGRGLPLPVIGVCGLEASGSHPFLRPDASSGHQLYTQGFSSFSLFLLTLKNFSPSITIAWSSEMVEWVGGNVCTQTFLDTLGQWDNGYVGVCWEYVWTCWDMLGVCLDVLRYLANMFGYVKIC